MFKEVAVSLVILSTHSLLLARESSVTTVVHGGSFLLLPCMQVHWFMADSHVEPALLVEKLVKLE